MERLGGRGLLPVSDKGTGRNGETKVSGLKYILFLRTGTLRKKSMLYLRRRGYSGHVYYLFFKRSRQIRLEKG